MSYDIDIAGQSFNYTWNLADLFYDILPHGGLKGLDNLPCPEAAAELAEAFDRLQHLGPTREVAAKYNPKNEWGDIFTATVLLGNLMALCYQHPEQRIYVC